MFRPCSQLCSWMECVASICWTELLSLVIFSHVYSLWFVSCTFRMFSCPISHCIVHCMMFLCEFCCYGVVFASLLATKIMWVGSQCTSLYIHIHICIYTHKAYLRSADLGFKTTKRVTLQTPSVIFFLNFLFMIVHSWMLFVEENVSLFAPPISEEQSNESFKSIS